MASTRDPETSASAAAGGTGSSSKGSRNGGGDVPLRDLMMEFDERRARSCAATHSPAGTTFRVREDHPASLGGASDPIWESDESLALWTEIVQDALQFVEGQLRIEGVEIRRQWLTLNAGVIGRLIMCQRRLPKRGFGALLHLVVLLGKYVPQDAMESADGGAVIMACLCDALSTVMAVDDPATDVALATARNVLRRVSWGLLWTRGGAGDSERVCTSTSLRQPLPSAGVRLSIRNTALWDWMMRTLRDADPQSSVVLSIAVTMTEKASRVPLTSDASGDQVALRPLSPRSMAMVAQVQQCVTSVLAEADETQLLNATAVTALAVLQQHLHRVCAAQGSQGSQGSQGPAASGGAEEPIPAAQSDEQSRGYTVRDVQAFVNKTDQSTYFPRLAEELRRLHDARRQQERLLQVFLEVSRVGSSEERYVLQSCSPDVQEEARDLLHRISWSLTQQQRSVE